MAQSIYAVNPHSDTQAIGVVIEQISKNPDKEVILRISEVAGSNIILSDIGLKQIATRKVNDTEYSVSLPFIGSNSTRDAIVELLKSDQDLDISLPTGYTAFQIDEGTTDLDDVGVDCFIDVQSLFSYLKSLGAQHTHKDDTSRWKGSEVLSGEMRESTLMFETEYRDLKMTKENAISHLKAASIGRFERPEVIKMSRVKKSRIFVVQNDTCEIQLIKGHEHSTIPMTKQRLLYLFDCFKEWLKLNEARWITMYFPSAQKFQYKLDRIRGWDIPRRFVSETSMVKSLFFLDTILWRPFYNAGTIPQKLEAVLFLLGEYGFDMDIQHFSGSADDYVSDRTRFQLPQRSQVVKTVVAHSESRGRGRSSYPSERGRVQRGREHFPSQRGREQFSSQRGRGDYSSELFSSQRGRALGETDNPFVYRRGRSRMS